jgi:hypothetical protein
MMLKAPSKAVSQIAEALNLPANTVAFTLRVRAGELAMLDVETYVEAGGAETLAVVLRRYRLEELAPATQEDTTRGEVIAVMACDSDGEDRTND